MLGKEVKRINWCKVSTWSRRSQSSGSCVFVLSSVSPSICYTFVSYITLVILCLTTVFAKFRYTDLVLTISWIWLLKCDLTLNRSINRLRRLINKDLNYFIQSINYPFSAYRILFRIRCHVSFLAFVVHCLSVVWHNGVPLVNGSFLATPTEYLNNVFFLFFVFVHLDYVKGTLRRRLTYIFFLVQ